MVVDGDMDELPAGASAVALSPAVAGDAMADLVETAQRFDVDVDRLARLLALVATDRLGGLQGADPVEAQPLGETSSPTAICLPVQRCRRSASTCSTTACGVGR